MKKNARLEMSIKLSLALLGSGMIWFYSGPFAAMASRELFTLSYDLLYGVPEWYNPSYMLTFAPLREHASNMAFDYGSLALATAGIPLLYKAMNGIKHMGHKAVAQLGITSAEPIADIYAVTKEEIDNLTAQFSHFLKEKNGLPHHENDNDDDLNFGLESESSHSEAYRLSQTSTPEPVNMHIEIPIMLPVSGATGTTAARRAQT